MRSNKEKGVFFFPFFFFFNYCRILLEMKGSKEGVELLLPRNIFPEGTFEGGVTEDSVHLGPNSEKS
jgi:hypothetical protein